MKLLLVCLVAGIVVTQGNNPYFKGTVSKKDFIFILHSHCFSKLIYFFEIYVRPVSQLLSSLKGHGNEADFLGFLQKLVPHRSLTLPFEPFQFWLRIRGDIRNQKTTLRLGESESRLLNV
jgi:hypothetical protein